MSRLGVISDEISQNLLESLKFALKYNLAHIELRSIWERNVVELNEDEIKRVRDVINSYEIKLNCLTTPIFKCGLTSTAEIKREELFSLSKVSNANYHINVLLPNALKIANELNVSKIRIFGFIKSDEKVPWTKIIKHVKRACILARNYGVILLIENEPVTFIQLSKELIKLLNEVNEENLKVCLDIGNAFLTGEKDLLVALDRLKSAIMNLHVKDLNEKKEWVAVGRGVLPYEKILQMLSRWYDNTITLETHGGRKLVKESCISLKELSLKLGVEKWLLS
jgi:sugar phosphate isomerase/epimerase